MHIDHDLAHGQTRLQVLMRLCRTCKIRARYHLAAGCRCGKGLVEAGASRSTGSTRR
ncbi:MULTISPECIES: hypothetical protein [Polaromonas]|uniref:Uncharacterized protein n=1 Tax=Polaromonas aquatica TaxID=332657 RepID=A0ABW1TUX1_9BURK